MIDTSIAEDTDGDKGDFVDFLENITPLGASPQSDVDDGTDEGPTNSILDSVDAASGTAAVDTPLLPQPPQPLTHKESESLTSVFAASLPLVDDMDAEALLTEKAKEGDEKKEVEVEMEVAPVVEAPAPSVFARLEEVCVAAPPSQEPTPSPLVVVAATAAAAAAAANVGLTILAPIAMLRLAVENPSSEQTRAEEADSHALAVARLQLRQQLAQWKFNWERVSRQAAQLAQHRLLQLAQE